MTAPVLVGVRCHYCSKFKNPHEVMRFTGGPIMCWRCYDWHQIALKILAGHPPRGCQECGVTFAGLAECEAGGDIRMYLHAKDGIYQVLCRACSDSYVLKRVDLYGNTAFGRSRKLTG